MCVPARVGSTLSPQITDPPARPAWLAGRPDSAQKLVCRPRARMGCAAVASTGNEHLFVGGASRLAAEHQAFSNTPVVADLLELLEEHVVMVALMRELLGPGVTVRIGIRSTPCHRPARLVVVTRAVPRRGLAGRYGRRSWADADGLPPRRRPPSRRRRANSADRFLRRPGTRDAMQDFYEILGVSRSSTDDEIKKAYRVVCAVPPRYESG